MNNITNTALNKDKDKDKDIDIDSDSDKLSLSDYTYSESSFNSTSKSTNTNSKSNSSISLDLNSRSEHDVTYDKYLERYIRYFENNDSNTESTDEDGEGEEDDSNTCKHYNNYCSLLMPCCDKFYDCIKCHNLSADHKVDPITIERLGCSNCGVLQNIGTNSCNNCTIVFGQYYCDKCRVFENYKQLYHCSICNQCRDISIKHCQTCNLCISTLEHKCKQTRCEDDCPICLETFENKNYVLEILNCGHALHLECFEILKKNSYKCPLCSKSMFNMNDKFKDIDNKIHHVSHNNMVNIYCNDCEKKSNVQFHKLGLKCGLCGSYNTHY